METSPELCDIIKGWFDGVTRGETFWVDRYVSCQPGVRLVGTDPDEWFEAGDVGDFLKEEAQALGGNVEISVEHVEAFQEGNVGWGVAQPLARLANGKTLSPRWSAVFHQEEGQWKLVQLHASVGISNEELLKS